MQKHIDKLAALDGVLTAVLVFDGETPIYSSSDVTHLPLATASLTVLPHTGHPSARVSVGDVVVHMRRFDGGSLAAVLLSGHPVTKSIKRLLLGIVRKATKAGS